MKRRQEEQAQREFLVQEVSRLVSDFSHRRSQEYEGMINVSRDRECSNTQRLRESSQTWAQNISSLDRHRETSNVELATESQSLCQLNEEAKEVLYYFLLTELTTTTFFKLTFSCFFPRFTIRYSKTIPIL